MSTEPQQPITPAARTATNVLSDIQPRPTPISKEHVDHMNLQITEALAMRQSGEHGEAELCALLAGGCAFSAGFDHEFVPGRITQYRDLVENFRGGWDEEQRAQLVTDERGGKRNAAVRAYLSAKNPDDRSHALGNFPQLKQAFVAQAAATAFARTALPHREDRVAFLRHFDDKIALAIHKNQEVPRIELADKTRSAPVAKPMDQDLSR